MLENNEKARYVLTTFSPTMFGEKASVHIQTITPEQAQAIIGPETEIVATRPSHENMAKRVFGDKLKTTRFADMHPEKNAILIHYRGPAVGPDGLTPPTGLITFFLIESEEYQEFED